MQVFILIHKTDLDLEPVRFKEEGPAGSTWRISTDEHDLDLRETCGAIITPKGYVASAPQAREIWNYLVDRWGFERDRFQEARVAELLQ